MLEVLLALSCSILGDDAVDEPEKPAWTWSSKEDRAIRKLEKKIEKGGDDKYYLEATAWKVTTYASPRMAAELSYYLELFEASMLEQLGLTRNFSVEPEVVVLSSYKEFQEKAPLSPGAGLVYEAVTDGRGKSRTRILENRLYTVVEDNPEPQFHDLPLASIRGQAAKSILIGVFGRPGITPWYEAGIVEFFTEWDLREEPKKGGYEARRQRSLGIDDLKEYCAERGNYLPAIEKLVASTPTAYRTTVMKTDMSDDAWSETVIDLLLTEKRARSVRDDIHDEILRVGMSGSGSAIIDERTAKAVARLWKRHVELVLAPKEEG